jgi:twitching motility protein PilT
MFRFNGDLIPLSDGQIIGEDTMRHWILSLVPPRLKDQIGTLEDLDFSFELSDGTRFRVNLFQQKQAYGMVLRVIQNRIRSMEELSLPPILNRFLEEKRGLVLVTGATGSGKSTTLAAMIDKINHTKPYHIITIEDPIEYNFQDAMSAVSQREIGIDTPSFGKALRSALRQDPDVILVGELRDSETVKTALKAAETGHLVFSTLHTTDATESMTRLMSYFEPHEHETIRMMLAATLRGVISQRLITTSNGVGRVAAFEIMVASANIRDLILNGADFDLIKDALKDGDNYGMFTFDQYLMELVENGIISEDIAISQASNKDDMRLLLSGIGA